MVLPISRREFHTLAPTGGALSLGSLYEGRYMTECGTAAFDVPFQSISECVRIKTIVGDILDRRGEADVPLIHSSLAATQL